MIYIISGTDRPGSRSRQVSNILKGLYDQLGANTEIMDLIDIPLNQCNGQYGQDDQSAAIKGFGDKLHGAEGFHIVCPEYNGSYPGALKFFIDHWKFPSTFEYRPVAFTGLGGRFGGMRPVEHLQGIFGYRNAYMYPRRVFLMNIFTEMKDGIITNDKYMEELQWQTKGFTRFVKAIHDAELDANTYIASQQK